MKLKVKNIKRDVRREEEFQKKKSKKKNQNHDFVVFDRAYSGPKSSQLARLAAEKGHGY